ncbi:uncharacterized protein LOC125958824 [Anopheles darlingi]|uniref:uncharacterized protein LOC125958824 n=1 Tax=Anopheles darlingi TaxID=43151 RepID=UPI0021005159|nr:uncharacterized protein LOC125958824 [Anopheles darlingi]
MEYENLLQFSLEQHLTKPPFAILDLFTEVALEDFNYSGLCNYTGRNKKAMKNYKIFTTCINNAWKEHYTEEETVHFVRRVIILIGNRKRSRRLKGKTTKNPAKKQPAKKKKITNSNNSKNKKQ